MYYLINIDTGVLVGTSERKADLVDQIKKITDRRSDWNTYVITQLIDTSTVRRSWS